MSGITRRLTVAELSQRILEMAKTGIYRESIFETFQPVATKVQIRQAIRHAKQFGLHSVAAMRDAELGTYYQVDQVKLAALQSALQVSLPLAEADVFQRMTEAMLTIRLMLAIAGAGAIALLGVGIVCLLTENTGAGWGLISSALSTIALWTVQKGLARKVM